MERAQRPGGHRQIWVQATLGALALGALVFAPPASGRMLIMPLGSQAAAHAPGVALSNGAILIGHGRLPGSLVVEGSRSTLLWAAARSGSLLLSANPAGCGSNRS